MPGCDTFGIALPSPTKDFCSFCSLRPSPQAVLFLCSQYLGARYDLALAVVFYAPPTRMLFTGMWTDPGMLASVLLCLCARSLGASKGRRTQLDDVANNTHNDETHAHCLCYPEELALISCDRSVSMHDLYMRNHLCAPIKSTYACYIV